MRTHGPQPGLARDQPPPPAADTSQEWGETPPRALSQDWPGTTHHHNQRTPATSGGEPHPLPLARIGERQATTTSSGPQPGVAGNRTQAPQPGLPRDHPPPRAAHGSQDWRGTAPRALSQDWRANTHHQNQGTPAGSGGEPHPRPSARIGEGPPTTTSSGSPPGVAGNCTEGLQPGLAGACTGPTHNTHPPHPH